MKTKTRLLKWEKTITVTAVYDGMDKANYKTLSVEIKVTGIECTHTDESQREIRNKVEATCTEDGYTGDIFCTNCQTLIRSGEIVNASGHQWKEEYTTDQTATCTDRGSKSIHCSKCDAIKEGSTEIIMALGHTGRPRR